MTIGEEVRPFGPAGFWRRLFAGLFDGLLLATAAVVMLMELIAIVRLADRHGWILPHSPETEALLGLLLAVIWALMSAIVVPVFYFTLCEGTFGQTVGKGLFGIKVVSAEGHPISYGRAFARLLTLPYSFVLFGIGFLWAALPPAKRTWHDYISVTRVISVP